jgi:hypothetical protein
VRAVVKAGETGADGTHFANRALLCIIQ